MTLLRKCNIISLFFLHGGGRQRYDVIISGTGRRTFTRSTSPQPPPSDNAAYKQGMEKLKQTNPILHKMTPPRGGTELPDAKFIAVFGVVASAGFYAWFIHDDSPTNRTK